MWFVCKIRYEKVQEDGIQKKVTEQYVVDALSFTEAETRIMEEMSSYISGELASPTSDATRHTESELSSASLLRQFEVVDISRAPFGEVFFAEDTMADMWFKAKLQFITIDENTEREKRSNVTYLVQAASLEGARKNIDEVMGTTMIDYVISGLNDTPIMDVFEYTKTEEKPEYE